MMQAYSHAAGDWPIFSEQKGNGLSTPLSTEQSNVLDRSVPLRVELGPTWHEMDQTNLNKLILSGLRTWTASIEACPQRVQAWSVSILSKRRPF